VAISIQEILNLSHLGCQLVAGRTGAEREVTWAHVCELEDPMPWLEGGELVMTTGMAIDPDPKRQVRYLSRLAASGAAALAISKDLRAPRLSLGFIDEADRTGFPILLVPIEVPFIAIARTVIMSNTDAAYREIVRQLSVFDALRAEVCGGGTAGLFRRLEDVSGFRLFLSSQAGAPLLPGVPAFPDKYKDLLARPSATPAFVPGGYALSVPINGRAAGSLLGLRRSDAEPGGLAALQHVATIAALERATLERERETERREGSELLAGLMNGRQAKDLGDRLSRRLREQDISLSLIQTSDTESVSGILHQQLTDIDCEHLILSQQEVIVLLTPTTANATVEQELGVVDGLHVGRSRPFCIQESFTLAEHQARLALSRALERSELLVDASCFAAELDWLPSGSTLRRAFEERVLGALLTEARGPVLLKTLRVWMQHDRRPSEAARRLDIHPHTLAYRLKRIEELTGLDLTSPGAIAELWLALEIRREDQRSQTR
jgi:PucR family transcriptional regulator, purine catabolism regulatory protein